MRSSWLGRRGEKMDEQVKALICFLAMAHLERLELNAEQSGDWGVYNSLVRCMAPVFPELCLEER